MTCAGSPVLCDREENTSSVYADEGTAAHTVAEWTLSQSVASAHAFKGRRVDVGHRTFEVDTEMAEAVDAYVMAVRSFAPEGSQTWVELEAPISHLTGEPDAAGTSDFVALLPNGELQVHDLKYGRGVAVSSEENTQLLTYALAVYDVVSFAEEVTSVRLFIHQPRLDHIDEWHTTVVRLEQHRADLRAAADRVNAADLDFKGGQGYNGEWSRRHLQVSEKGCRFCRAKATCPAFQKTVVSNIRGAAASADDFEDLTVETVQEGTERLGVVGPAAIAAKLRVVDAVEEWCAAVRAKALAILAAGEDLPGFKLVQGKRGNRRWKDPEAAEAALKAFRLKVEEMYDLKLVSPTTAEKLAKAGTIGPRQWAKAQALIEQPDGKPHVTTAEDKRPAISLATSPGDFEDLSEEPLA
jgi:hypothetical protein